MRLKNLLASFFFVFAMGTGGMAQDIHFTLWDMSPLTVNPAFTGSYLGSFRVGGIYRDQWRSIPGAAGIFTTPSAYIDAPIIRGLRKNDWVGVGLMMFQDKAGTFDLGYGAQHLSASYHLGLNKKSTSTLTLGIQGGASQLNIDILSGLVKDQDDEFSTSSELKTNYRDYKGGLLFKALLNKRMNMAIGASVGRVTTPRYSLLSSNMTVDTINGVPVPPATPVDRPMLTVVHGQFGIGLNEKMTLTPQFLFQTTGGATEVSLQTYLGYKINKDYTLRPGLGYRMTGNDAIEALIGLDMRDNLRATIGYDINISELASATSGQGAFEIAVYYIGKIYKKPDIKPAILCPRL